MKMEQCCRKVTGAIRPQVNAKSLQLECGRVWQHEALFVPDLIYGNATTVAQFLRMEKMENTKIVKWYTKRSDQKVVQWVDCDKGRLIQGMTVSKKEPWMW